MKLSGPGADGSRLSETSSPLPFLQRSGENWGDSAGHPRLALAAIGPAENFSGGTLGDWAGTERRRANRHMFNLASGNQHAGKKAAHPDWGESRRLVGRH